MGRGGRFTGMALHTRLAELLEIEHPVMPAGMGGVSYHRLVASVSEAGGIGPFGGEDGLVVDVSREFMPCGQGVGAINSLEYAGDIVRSMVAEAERVMERLASVRR